MARYDQMYLADASIVVMSERHPRSQVLTVEPMDFSIYRRNDRLFFDFIAPPKSKHDSGRDAPSGKESSIVDLGVTPPSIGVRPEVRGNNMGSEN
jgi:hypothetical protein